MHGETVKFEKKCVFVCVWNRQNAKWNANYWGKSPVAAGDCCPTEGILHSSPEDLTCTCFV